jgi:hypothetical protein
MHDMSPLFLSPAFKEKLEDHKARDGSQLLR